MRYHTALTVFVAACVFAQTDIIPADSVLEPGPFQSVAGESAAKAAGRHPNTTSEVTFQRATTNGAVQTWTWRINVTDLVLPNNIENYGLPSEDYSDGYHAINMQWQLEWPQSNPGSNQSLQSFLLDHGDNYFYVQAFAMIASSNITKSWSSPSDGNCNSVLGDACTASLTQAAASAEQADYYDLLGCENTFDIAFNTPGTVGTGYGTSSLIKTIVPLFHQSPDAHSNNRYTNERSKQAILLR